MMARRFAMKGMPSFLPTDWTKSSWALGRGGSWKMPSGAEGMPSRVPVTPMNFSALS
jgi:hypothetical protein